MQIHIGTSGWQYEHWRGVFYPEAMKKADWLPFYARHFDTLEVNSTFYRDARPSTYEKWYSAVPDNFRFSLKMPRFITHIKRLKTDGESVHRFTEHTQNLRDKLGIILIQLPPGLIFDETLIKDFFDLLSQTMRYTVEARNKTFLNDTFLSLLEKYGIAWCIADSAGRFPYCEAVTAPFVYIRLHGSQKLYASDYSNKELETWRDKTSLWGRETFIYFDNDFYGYAVSNAMKLMLYCH